MKTYLLTGVDCRGKRFRKDCGRNYFYALAHNVWRGSLWEIIDGRRRLVASWWNY